MENFRECRMISENHLLGLDIGTTAVKVGLFTVEGKLKALSNQEYDLYTLSPNMIELPGDIYWTACVRGTRDVLSRSGVNPESVVALSLASQAETLICLDKSGRTLRNAIVWMDTRAEKESQEIAKEVASDLFYRTTGLPRMSPIWPVCKILWLKRNEPEVFKRTSKFLIVKDYLIWRLTGQFLTEPSESSSTGYYRLENEDWWDEMLDLIGIKRNQLPVICSSDEVIGTINREVRSELNLGRNTKVVAGSMDQTAAALGAGNIEPGCVTESTGAALGVVATVNKPVYDRKRRIPCVPHCVPGKFVLLPWSETSGIVLKWFKNTFPSLGDRKENYEELLELASQVPCGAEGLFAFPHFSGTTCPDFNPQARGAFVGISFRHKRAHFIRALVESVAFMLKDNIELLKNLSLNVERIRSLGGAAKSDFWLKIKANVLGLPVEVPQCSEAACLGAMILAGVGTKVFSNIRQTVDRVVKIEKSFHFEPSDVALYQKAYREYRSLYQRLYRGGEPT